MQSNSSFATLIFVVPVAVGVAFTYAVSGFSGNWQANWVLFVFVVAAFALASAIKVANSWQQAVILRLGRFMTSAGFRPTYRASFRDGTSAHRCPANGVLSIRKVMAWL